MRNPTALCNCYFLQFARACPCLKHYIRSRFVTPYIVQRFQPVPNEGGDESRGQPSLARHLHCNSLFQIYLFIRRQPFILPDWLPPFTSLSQRREFLKGGVRTMNHTGWKTVAEGQRETREINSCAVYNQLIIRVPSVAHEPSVRLTKFESRSGHASWRGGEKKAKRKETSRLCCALRACTLEGFFRDPTPCIVATSHGARAGRYDFLRNRI